MNDAHAQRLDLQVANSPGHDHLHKANDGISWDEVNVRLTRWLNARGLNVSYSTGYRTDFRRESHPRKWREQ